MYKIGELSSLSKVTIKAIRYYEEEGLLNPTIIDPNTNYRYYDINKLIELKYIVSLRDLGLSIKDIKKVIDGNDIKEILNNHRNIIEAQIINYTKTLSKIDLLLEDINMSSEIILKVIPDYLTYYRDGVIEDFSKITDFVLETGSLCKKLNPSLTCHNDGYCFISYLDNEYKEKDIKIRYQEACNSLGVEGDGIKFMKLESIRVLSIMHHGSYSNLRESYLKLLKYIEDNHFEIIDSPRECYIDGCWNKENENDYLTEIQFPIK